jgi:hemin uptake protein HemP
MTEPRRPKPPSGVSAESVPVVIDARQIFGDGREVWIDHEGVRYRLRITRRNKLILQK